MEKLEIYDCIELADGTLFPCDYLSTIPEGFMYIALKNTTMGAVADAFDDTDKISVIKYGKYELKNYILIDIKKEGEGRYKITMRKKFVDE